MLDLGFWVQGVFGESAFSVSEGAIRIQGFGACGALHSVQLCWGSGSFCCPLDKAFGRPVVWGSWRRLSGFKGSKPPNLEVLGLKGIGLQVNRETLNSKRSGGRIPAEFSLVTFMWVFPKFPKIGVPLLYP